MSLALLFSLGLSLAAQSAEIELDPTPAVRFEAVVQEINAHHVLLGVKVDPGKIGDLLSIGYKKVDRPEQVAHKTIYEGRAFASRLAIDPEVFARFKPGAVVQCEARRTYEGTMVITSAR